MHVSIIFCTAVIHWALQRNMNLNRYHVLQEGWNELSPFLGMSIRACVGLLDAELSPLRPGFIIKVLKALSTHLQAALLETACPVRVLPVV